MFTKIVLHTGETGDKFILFHIAIWMTNSAYKWHTSGIDVW